MSYSVYLVNKCSDRVEYYLERGSGGGATTSSLGGNSRESITLEDGDAFYHVESGMKQGLILRIQGDPGSEVVICS